MTLDALMSTGVFSIFAKHLWFAHLNWLRRLRGRSEERNGLEEGNRGVMYRSKIRGMKHNVASSRESMTDIKRLQVVDSASRK
jgi:hypothetical protein